jgi:hypothetical protein
MVFKRKEAKDYGCKKMVEGTYKEGDVCLLIEDVVVYGTSIIETSEVSLFLISSYSEIDPNDNLRYWSMIFQLKLFFQICFGEKKPFQLTKLIQNTIL